MNIRYFKEINSKEKAYWLGFLYADGNVYIDKRKKNTKRIQIVVSHKDGIILENFVNDVQSTHKIHKYNNHLSLAIGCTKMCDDLINHGCVPRKSLIIRLPKLESRELYLAFLLGYYDGDGDIRGRITSGSKKFIEDIKKYFQIQNKIVYNNGNGELEGRIIVGKTFRLILGANLFNEMMDNYSKSLNRKRKKFCTKKERLEKIRKKCSGVDLKGKLSSVTKYELEKLVWKKPMTKIAEDFNVSDAAIRKKVKSFSIKKPPRNYWLHHSYDS